MARRPRGAVYDCAGRLTFFRQFSSLKRRVSLSSDDLAANNLRYVNARPRYASTGETAYEYDKSHKQRREFRFGHCAASESKRGPTWLSESYRLSRSSTAPGPARCRTVENDSFDGTRAPSIFLGRDIPAIVFVFPRSYSDSSGGPTAASRDNPGRPVPLVMFATVEKTLQAAPARVARDRVRRAPRG